MAAIGDEEEVIENEPQRVSKPIELPVKMPAPIPVPISVPEKVEVDV